MKLNLGLLRCSKFSRNIAKKMTKKCLSFCNNYKCDLQFKKEITCKNNKQPSRYVEISHYVISYKSSLLQTNWRFSAEFSCRLSQISRNLVQLHKFLQFKKEITCKNSKKPSRYVEISHYVISYKSSLLQTNWRFSAEFSCRLSQISRNLVTSTSNT